MPRKSYTNLRCAVCGKPAYQHLHSHTRIWHCSDKCRRIAERALAAYERVSKPATKAGR